MDIVVNIDEAFDIYYVSRNSITNTPIYFFSFITGRFERVQGQKIFEGVAFINANNVCTEIINKYLVQAHIKPYADDYKRKAKLTHKKVTCFLNYFEHIDGCYDFEKYEINSLTKILKDWCKENNLCYTEPVVYSLDNIRNG